MGGRLPRLARGNTQRKRVSSGLPLPNPRPEQAGEGRESRQRPGGPSHRSLLHKPGTTGCTDTVGWSLVGSTGEPTIPETIKHLPGLCFLGFIPRSSVSTPAANFSSLVPAPAAHLDLLPALVQLLGAQGGLSGRHFAFALLQPLPHGPDQLPKLIQLLLAGRCILCSASEKGSESQSSCFALQLPLLECSTVVSPEAFLFIIIIIRCCLGTAHTVPAKAGCTPQPPLTAGAPQSRGRWHFWGLSGTITAADSHGTTPAILCRLCTGLFVLGDAKLREDRAHSCRLAAASCSPGEARLGLPSSLSPALSHSAHPGGTRQPPDGSYGPSGSSSPTAAASSPHGAGRRQLSAPR